MMRFLVRDLAAHRVIYYAAFIMCITLCMHNSSRYKKMRTDCFVGCKLKDRRESTGESLRKPITLNTKKKKARELNTDTSTHTHITTLQSHFPWA